MWNRQREAQTAREMLRRASATTSGRAQPQSAAGRELRCSDVGRMRERRTAVVPRMADRGTSQDCAMSIVNSIRSQLAPIHPRGLSVRRRLCARERSSCSGCGRRSAGSARCATLWCAYFFRDPPRVTPVRDGLVVAPADGRVSQIANAVPPQRARPRRPAAAAHLDLHERVRLPREPQPGRRPRRAHRLSRRHVPQRRSRQGERGQRAQRLRHRHRAPARASAWCRSPAWSRGASSASSREGEAVGAGERFGMIRFGSRVDVYLPEGARAAGGRGPDRDRRRDRARRSARRPTRGRTFRVA